MATPCSFAESNNVLSIKEDSPIQGIEPLSVFQGPLTNDIPVTISCWKLSQEELDEINRTKRVWVIVLGLTTFPLMIDGIAPKFYERNVDES